MQQPTLLFPRAGVDEGQLLAFVKKILVKNFFAHPSFFPQKG